MKTSLRILLLMLLAVVSHGADLSNDTLSGTWMFTHMILDGERTVPVKRRMDFLPSGALINYDRKGEEHSRATYVIEGGVIKYSDKRGSQTWKVKQFDGDALIVDHAGAEMFFSRP